MWLVLEVRYISNKFLNNYIYLLRNIPLNTMVTVLFSCEVSEGDFSWFPLWDVANANSWWPKLYFWARWLRDWNCLSELKKKNVCFFRKKLIQRYPEILISIFSSRKEIYFDRNFISGFLRYLKDLARVTWKCLFMFCD